MCDSAGKDEDCDNSTFGQRDIDNDGFFDAACCNGANCGDDCDDTDAQRHPTASEVCNEVDDNCDGAIDDGVLITGYRDSDRDGYGAPDAGGTQVCDYELGQGYSAYANDCEDSNTAITLGSIICVGGQMPHAVRICQSDGGWLLASCAPSTLCYVQPNGTGICR